MRKTLWLLGLTVAISPALAQRQDHYHHSVFYGLPDLTPAVTHAANRAATPAWQQTLPGWISAADPRTGMYRDLFGPAIAVAGNNLEDRAADCIRRILPSLGIDVASWKRVQITDAPHAGYVHYDQYYNGRKVAFAQLTLRFTKDGKLQRIRHRAYGAAKDNPSPVVSRSAALRAAAQDLEDVRITAQETAADWEWFPVPTEEGYTLHPAWPFTISGRAADGMEMQLTGYVDALDGQLLYRDNHVKETFDMRVVGEIYPLTPSQAPVTVGLADLTVSIGGVDYLTGTDGYLNVPSLTPPVNATIHLRGRWAEVNAELDGGTVPSFIYDVNTNGTEQRFRDTGISSIRHVNAYYHVTKAHDFMKSLLPGFTGLDVPVKTKVDVAGNCNAFYSGRDNTLNFYEAGAGCNSFALCSDIIYHEYGHAIANRFYSWQGSGGMRNGALNEGHADIWALGHTQHPVLGSGAYTGGGFIRRYDAAPKVYPQDLRGEVHADGEIIAGAWWDLGVNMGSVDSMIQLFAKTWYDIPDGPNGMEGAVYHDVLISALLNDDDDNNLGNGTPHMNAIVSAFARHGIYMLAHTEVLHEEAPHHPAGTPVTVTATVQLPPDNLPLFREIKLFYRVRPDTVWTSVNMTPQSQGSMDFSGVIPGQEAGRIVDYYFALYDYTGVASGFAPQGFNPGLAATQSTIPYQFGFGLEAKTTVDFETEVEGWQIGNVQGDNATSGIWVRAVPIETYQNSVMGKLLCQPGFDHTHGEGGYCLVTGNAPGGIPPTNLNVADVDNGITSVVTPVFDLSGYKQPVVEYYRWFSNDRGSNARTDPWQVQIRDGNAGVWIFSVENTYQSDYNWRRRIFSVKEYLPNSSSIQLKFIAADRQIYNLPNNGQGTVEAAVDDFRIFDLNPASGIAETVSEDRLVVYPNPADESLHITLPEGSGEGTISLYDVTGRMVANVAIQPDLLRYEVSTRLLPVGQYLLTVQTDRQIWGKKVQVIH
jgi:hypothetical protein